MKKPKKYWYKFFSEYCVLCGRENKWKERQYSKKPKSNSKRYSYKETACSSHFV